MRGVAAPVGSLLAFHSVQLLRTSFFVQTALAAPISFALLRVLGAIGSETPVPSALWLDSAIAGMWATTTTAVGIIGYQRFQGTLEQLAFSVLRPGMVFGTLTAAATVIGVVGVPIGVVVQLAITGSIAVELSSVVSYLFAVVSCAASAAVLASLFIFSRFARAFEPLVLVPVWLITGIVVPLSVLPAWLQPVALFHPLTAAVHAGRQEDMTTALPWLLGSLVIALLWMGIATLALGHALKRARAAGTLGLS